MRAGRAAGLQLLVFGLVAATFATIYITQPVLPVLRAEFGVSASGASLTVSAVILGIALATLPFGMLVDAFPLRPIIFSGGSAVTALSLVCATTKSFPVFVAARFLQGLFIPSLTTCLVVFLVRSLPPERLNVAMGSYVSATVAGGLGGRLLGGWIHPPLHWRYAFVTAAALLLSGLAVAYVRLPRTEGEARPRRGQPGVLALLRRPELLRICFVAFGIFFVFSSVFNYLPFYLAGPDFGASTEFITLLYLSYLAGVFIGPVAGKISNRIGNGATMAWGSAVFALAIAATLVRSLPVIAGSLVGVCAGFFTVHAAAAGALNRKLAESQGRANSLYVLFYYLGGSAGITASGYAYGLAGWRGVATLGIGMLALPFATGLRERREPPTATDSGPGTTP